MQHLDMIYQLILRNNMGCNQSKIDYESKVITTKVHDHYIAFVNVGHRFRILCQSTDLHHVDTIIEKYLKDPGSFTFRYKDYNLKNTTRLKQNK